MILLDFDNTLNPGPYTNRFECNGVPTPEAKAAVKAYREAGLEVVIFTARLSDSQTNKRDWMRITNAIQDWTIDHFDGWVPKVTCIKHPGVIIDDNAYRFTGTWPDADVLLGHGQFKTAAEYTG